ncbi:unnamed protein product [Withania somnifera]
MVAKKGGSKGGAEEELARTPLQAIILADSFTTKFRTITLERRKVLLPLVNAPMIDYTLAWLESADVEEVFVFCCAHLMQVIDYLDKSNWFNQPNFSVTTIESHNAISAGDALRLIYEKHVALLADNTSISFQNNKQIMGYKIYTHEIHSSYAARIDNYRSYDTISKDIIRWWTYPFVPDVQFFGNYATKLERQQIKQSRSSKIGPFTVIGTGTSIGDNTEISNSVIGEGCSIGSNVAIEGCYIWNNVTIEDGCKLKHSIVCDGVTMISGAASEPGVVLSFKVVVGRYFLVPAYSNVSLLQQPIKQDSDEELEYADNSSGITEVPCFIWLVSEGGQEEDWRHSVAPIPVDKLFAVMQITNDEADIANENGAFLPPSGELGPDSITNDSNEDAEDTRDDSIIFEREVEATFQRAVEEDVTEDHVILEVNSLRLSYNMTSADCAGALFYSVMKLALDAPHDSPNELCKNVVSTVKKWKKLLMYYLSSIDEEIEVILKFEEMCLESTKEYCPLFERILDHLYDQDIIQEEAVLEWASEKEGAEEPDKIFVKQSENFIQVQAPEEGEED